jgi:predicted 2-oxoglutarate/Fe(II)-dependent dioxygenase YbiX
MIVVDNFIKDPLFLKQLEENKKEFFSENGTYHWWNGWWNSPDDTIKKQLISYIWRDYPMYPSVSLDGFEYWTGQFGEGAGTDKLDMHLDKDEELWKSKGELSSPIVGTVFYPVEMDIEGGYLEIFSSGPEKQPERIQAKHNRLIIFDAGGTHHRVTAVTKGTRSAIAINLWDKKPEGELKFE